LRSTKRTST